MPKGKNTELIKKTVCPRNFDSSGEERTEKCKITVFAMMKKI